MPAHSGSPEERTVVLLTGKWQQVCWQVGHTVLLFTLKLAVFTVQ
jgi:hypothetical protein